MNINQSIDRLLLSHPSYASQLLKLNTEITTDTDTADVDGVTLRINPDFWSELIGTERDFLLAHESMHVVLMHHLRRGDRDPDKWNRACDYEINPLLVGDGLKMPDGGLLSYRYHGMSAEDIYELLPDDGKSAPGGVKDHPEIGEQNPEDLKTEQMISVMQDQTLAERAGIASAGMTRAVQAMTTEDVAWHELFRQYLTEQCKSDYTWARPNRRYRDVYMPSLTSMEIGTVAVVSDTSGSVDESILSRMAAELNNVAPYLNKVVTMACDTRVHDFEVFERGEDIEISTTGGGGTDFRPPFQAIDDSGEQIKLLVYLTDGRCYSFPEEPDYPVLWVVYGGYNFRPPFGETIHIN